jgi:hypothetical protein
MAVQDPRVARHFGQPGGQLPAEVGQRLPVVERGTVGRADVAQLVAHHLAKVRVAGSNPVVRSEARRLEEATEVSVEWPRGEATACKAVYTGSNPVSTSHSLHASHWAIGAVW